MLEAAQGFDRILRALRAWRPTSGPFIKSQSSVAYIKMMLTPQFCIALTHKPGNWWDCLRILINKWGNDQLLPQQLRDINSQIYTTRIYSNDIRMLIQSQQMGPNGNHERHDRTEGTLQIFRTATNTLGLLKWQTWGGYHEISHSQKPPVNKPSLKLSAERKQNIQDNKHLPVIWYTAGIINWPKEEIEVTDVKTRKLLTMDGRFHTKSSNLRLYIKPLKGSWELMSIRATLLDEYSST